MSKVSEIVHKVRSKNAGPFWLTIDIFCGTPEAYTHIVDGLSTQRVAALLKTDAENLKRFDIADLNVVKFSMPRPTIQGARDDRDMHGAGWAPLLAELEIG